MTRPTLITVRGQFLRVDGTPEIGYLEFQSRVYALYSLASRAVVPSSITVAIDSEGNFEIEIPATNDPDWAPIGWTYTLVIRLSNDYSIYDVSIPYDATNAELSLGELLPAEPSTGIVPGNYAPLVHNHAASAIVSGTIALARLPVGVTAGTIAAGNHTHEGGGSGGPIAIEDITGLTAALNDKANTAHIHGIGSVINLQTLLDGKSDIAHTHSIANVTNLQTTLDTKPSTADLAEVAFSGSYDDLADKPAFPGSPVTSVAGRLGDVVLTKSDVGLANVDNTSDSNKPVSSATQTALDAKAASNHVHAQSEVTGLTSALSGKANTSHTHVQSDITGLEDVLDDKVNSEDLSVVATTGSYDDLIDKPTIPVTSVAGRTGDVTLAKSDVGLANVDNTTDANKPVSTATQTALDLKAPLASPTFTGTVSGVTKVHVGLSNVDNTADTAKPVSADQQTALNLKANLASPTFTGTVAGITKAMVGLSNVDNTADSAKPVSTAQQTALNLKANLASPTFTGTVSGISKTMVGLGNVDNTSDAGKPISTATQTALDLKASTTSVTAVSDRVTAVEDMTPVVMVWNGSAYVESTTARIYVGPNDPGTVPNGSVWIDTDA